MTRASLPLDPILLESFVTVAQCRSFTVASSRLGLSQSTVSQHIRRLEHRLGRILFVRDTHSVLLTEDGNAMVRLATAVLESNTRLMSHFNGVARRVRLRLGISEDFAMSRLAGVLTRFREAEPFADVELTVGLSEQLYQAYNSGDLDVIFAKRKNGDDRGTIAWRGRLIWIASSSFAWNGEGAIPLVLYSPPSMTRTIAIESLDRAGLSWRVGCSSGSLSGLRAALAARLGVAAFAECLIPDGLSALDRRFNLPALPDTEFVALGPGKSNPIANRMIQTLLSETGRLMTGG
ncbi:LysR substrate-binding domain-containing protein [Mesorhizobium sp. CO1-1-8]|uniref:LysR substrate-binding domain-containing protein n=1 Tax=Mesorhizobium sp. CO1-1-8 TaxID=2876631 RepID=UPI001CD14402|nr:LysR substrate-binding domain-containing protein [Mesorhizobium sp. CO1-1-8]MBZ9772586.1 LysR family transcriptional regulator [Mesorhizobium sp. CO1-1-8]